MKFKFSLIFIICEIMEKYYLRQGQNDYFVGKRNISAYRTIEKKKGGMKINHLFNVPIIPFFGHPVGKHNQSLITSYIGKKEKLII